MIKFALIAFAGCLLVGCHETHLETDSDSTAKTVEEFARELGEHAGEAEYAEAKLKEKLGGTFSADMQYARVIYARYWVCSFSQKAMDEGDFMKDGRIWSAYTDAALISARGGEDIPAPLNLDSKAKRELGEDCNTFMGNAPNYIIQDSRYGPFDENPS